VSGGGRKGTDIDRRKYRNPSDRHKYRLAHTANCTLLPVNYTVISDMADIAHLEAIYHWHLIF